MTNTDRSPQPCHVPINLSEKFCPTWYLGRGEARGSAADWERSWAARRFELETGKTAGSRRGELGNVGPRQRGEDARSEKTRMPSTWKRRTQIRICRASRSRVSGSGQIGRSKPRRAQQTSTQRFNCNHNRLPFPQARWRHLHPRRKVGPVFKIFDLMRDESLVETLPRRERATLLRGPTLWTALR